LPRWCRFIGSALALACLPAATLGLMAATREANRGNFPMPSILITAFRAGKARLNAMLVLGALYALGFLLVMGISALIDGGKVANLYLVGGRITEELVATPNSKARCGSPWRCTFPSRCCSGTRLPWCTGMACPPSKACFSA
jgi:hypothetical protein